MAAPYSILNRYGFIGSLRLVRDYLFTRLFFSSARLVRWPIYQRGASLMRLGAGLTTGVGVRLDAFSDHYKKVVLVIGDNVQINDYVHIAAIEEVSIGSGSLIASRVFISDHNHGQFHGNSIMDGPEMEPAKRPLSSNPVRIGENVWIGEQVCILPGVMIGDGAVIGAGSVVTRDVPPACVVAGNPARVLRKFDVTTNEWKRV
ncbi:MAG: DapH/DapD/GlmU-related protein [Sideroxydans sp.]